MMTTAQNSTAPTPRRAPAKVRRARRESQAQNRSLTEEVMTQGALKAAAVVQAKAITKGHLTPAELQTWLKDMEARLQIIQEHLPSVPMPLQTHRPVLDHGR